MWGLIIEALFSNSIVLIRRGDTVLRNINSQFKVDYRLGVSINQKLIDISNIEVAKQATSEKVRDDYVKLVLEAKAIIQRIVGPFYFIKPSLLAAFSFQICGLEADITQTTLSSPSKYITERVCGITHAPTSPISIKQMKTFIQTLTPYKENVEAAGALIKDEANKALDRCFSLGPILTHLQKIFTQIPRLD